METSDPEEVGRSGPTKIYSPAIVAPHRGYGECSGEIHT